MFVDLRSLSSVIAIHDFNDPYFEAWTRTDEPWLHLLKNQLSNARVMTFSHDAASINNLDKKVSDLGFKLFSELYENRNSIEVAPIYLEMADKLFANVW